MIEPPDSTSAEEWAEAFRDWYLDPNTTLVEESMAEWFDAAFQAARSGLPANPRLAEQLAKANPILDGPPPGGVWVAYHYDGQGVVPFADELDALRHAVAKNCDAKFVHYGKEVLEKP
jgi:hypothetical protein